MAKTPKARRGLGRTTGTVDLLPKLLIVCEGKTEKVLLDQLRRRWRISSVEVRVDGEAGVPSTVVSHAKTQRRKYGETWVAFDRDEHPCWSQAIDHALTAKLGLAISNPCIELWAILLHQDQSAHLTRHEAQRTLKKLHPDYDHEKSPFISIDVVLEHHEEADRRARAICRFADEMGEPYRCPTTRFHEIVARLKALKL